MGTCRVAELAVLVAHLDGDTSEFRFVRGCASPALYRTGIQRELADGSVIVSARVELCDQHDRIARLDEGYCGTWVLRSDPIAP